MQIFIKNVSGDSKCIAGPSHPNTNHALQDRQLTLSSSVIPMVVPVDTSIQNLTTLLSLRTSLPEASLRLVYAGRHLSSSPSQSLSDLRITSDSIIHLALPLRGGMPPKKIRCTHKDCKEASQRIVGDCGFCNGHFCGKHRLLEDHKCTGLEDVSHDFSASPSRSPISGSVTKRHGSKEGGVQWWLVGLGFGLGDLDEELLADMS
jgi:hypothetical protein